MPISATYFSHEEPAMFNVDCERLNHYYRAIAFGLSVLTWHLMSLGSLTRISVYTVLPLSAVRVALPVIS
jgi:hypothetical protein